MLCAVTTMDVLISTVGRIFITSLDYFQFFVFFIHLYSTTSQRKRPAACFVALLLQNIHCTTSALNFGSLKMADLQAHNMLGACNLLDKRILPMHFNGNGADFVRNPRMAGFTHNSAQFP